jgi:hypothetical protein
MKYVNIPFFNLHKIQGVIVCEKHNSRKSVQSMTKLVSYVCVGEWCVCVCVCVCVRERERECLCALCINCVYCVCHYSRGTGFVL